ncbi:multiple cyclophane-containing RiPP AmcA [Saccharopolyspora spinosa]
MRGAESGLRALLALRPQPAPVGAWDNRDSWDNVGGGFDNRPAWDNWNKR